MSTPFSALSSELTPSPAESLKSEQAAGENVRVIIRGKSGDEGGEHFGGSWKIAYSDFITAMMSFFLVMWLISILPHKSLAGVAAFFRRPLVEAIQGNPGGPAADTSRSVIPGGSPTPIPNPGAVSLKPSAEDLANTKDVTNLENLKRVIETKINADPVLRQYRPQMLLDMTPDGLRVQILDGAARPMFATGSAKMLPDMRAILQLLAPVLATLPNKIRIVGHTDDAQYAAGDREYSNWELSADRANAARRALLAGGYDTHQVLQVVGLADTVSLVPGQPDAAVNRRISLIVLTHRAERVITRQQYLPPVSARTVTQAANGGDAGKTAVRPLAATVGAATAATAGKAVKDHTARAAGNAINSTVRHAP